jgi:inhibitor of KinA
MPRRPRPAADTDAPAITPAGDAAVLVRYAVPAAGVGAELAARVQAGLRALDQGRDAGWLDVMPGYASLLVVFDPLRTDAEAVAERVDALLRTTNASASPAPRRVCIPVLYDPEVAPDLVELAESKELSLAQVVALHTAPIYRCHMLGFRPGFPFLSGLDPRLTTPRLPTPRTAVPAGAVAIAGQQAGVYPSAGPGGWRIVGRTPLQLFDARRTPACLIEAGDEVTFEAIDRARFDRLSEGATPG